MLGAKRDESVSALLVGDYSGDRLIVHDVFRRAGWRLFEARERRNALSCLQRNPVQVVIAEKSLRNWSWKRILSDLRRLIHPPQLIVTSPTADERLWAEALNVGVFDLLRQPFDRDEVERVIAAARRYFD